MPALIGDVSGTGGLRQKRGEETGEGQSRDAVGAVASCAATCIAIRVSVFIGTCDTTATVAPLGVGADRAHRLRP